jgi:hypothetical protein
MLTFSNPVFKFAGSAQSGRDAIPARVITDVRSVDVHCTACGHRRTARVGDGHTYASVGGLQVECSQGHASAVYPPPTE